MVNYIKTLSRSGPIQVNHLPADIRISSRHAAVRADDEGCLLQKRYQPQLLQNVLEMLSQNRPGDIHFSSNRIVLELRRKQISCSAITLRTLFSDLENLGLIKIGRTKQGTILTEAGHEYFRAASFSEMLL